MARKWIGVFSLFPVVVALWPAAATERVLTSRMHHLRSGADREWAAFPAQAGSAELALAFDAEANGSERTLRLRHRDLKQLWLVQLNGEEIARLPFEEADSISYWPIRPGTLRDGRNELRISSAGKISDDVMIGEAWLIDRPRDQVVSDATVDLSVFEKRGGRSTPGRITVVDDNGTRIPLGSVSDTQQAVRPGVVYTRSGAARLTLPAGRYVIYAGRGFEYSVDRTVVDLRQGSHVSRRLAIERQVDTSGWAAMDTHLHTGTFARHGDASIEERMLTIAGEGVEIPVSTEHNMVVDFDARARHAGVREHFTPVAGSEVTTPALGHFNVFPIANGGRPIDHRAADWVRLRESIGRSAGNPLVVLNHGRDLHGGFRPLDRARHISAAGEDMQGWPLPANAMEVMNSGAVMTDGFALARDWMGMLNRGLALTPIGSSDAHDVARYIVGQARTYVRCGDDDPGNIDLSQVMESLRRGTVMVSYGLLTELDVSGKGPGDLLRATGDLDVRIRVKGPEWTRAERVALYVNGVKTREQAIEGGRKAGLKWEATWRLAQPVHDVHLAAIASGPGIAAPYWPTAKPYQPTSIEFAPYVLGLSGAVFVDADRSGRFESAFEYARREVTANPAGRPLVSRLASYDAAVATQAASVLRARDPAGFERTLGSMIHEGPPHVAAGLRAYLEAWKESQSGRLGNPNW